MKYTTLCLLVLIGCCFASHADTFDFDDVSHNVQIHGFLSQGYLESDANQYFAGTREGTFQFNEFALNFSTDLTDRLRAGLQLFSRDLGDEGNNELVLDWAYADYRWKDWFGIRIGKIKSPYGFYNETRDLDMLRTWIFLPHIYNETWRDVYLTGQGLEVYGYSSLHKAGDLAYQLQYGVMNLTETGSIAKMIEFNSGMSVQQADSTATINSSVEWLSPVTGLRFGGTVMAFEMEVVLESTGEFYWADQDIPPGIHLTYTMEDVRIAVLSAEYRREKVTLAAEWMQFLADSRFTGQSTGWDGQESYYASLAYRVCDWWEIGAYYSVFYPERNDKEGRTYEQTGRGADYRQWQKEWVFTSRFDLNEHWTLKLEGHLIDGAGIVQQYNPRDDVERDSFLFAIKTTFNF